MLVIMPPLVKITHAGHWISSGSFEMAMGKMSAAR